MDRFNEELKNATNPWIKRIGEYLLSREDLKENLKKENKTLSECFDYVLIEISKKAKNQAGVAYVCGDDEHIYELAVHYYDEDNIKVDKKNFTTNADGSADASKLINSFQKNSDEQKNIQKKIDQEVAKALEKYKKDEKEKVRKKKRVVKDINANQLNLFDLDNNG